ncbi:MAG TPA: hypothetical protein ENJ95_02710 [Bacteroidetes bacterium]|nr:hypothetical protein [Bacteroidota bacterium]
MIYAIGTKVKFLHTGDEGVVRSLLDNGMLNIYLPAENMEIPAAPEDLFRVEDAKKQKAKAKVVPGKKKKPAPKAPPIKIETQYSILKSYGIQLAFLPKENAQGLVENYTIYLLNDTKYDAVYDLRLLLNYRTQTWSGKLPATSFAELGEMIYDDLNEAPEFETEISWVTTAGVEEPLFKSLKIKAKSFFKAIKTAPLLNKPTHLYRLFDKPGAKEEKKEEDLQAYTKRHAKPTWYKGNDYRLINAVDTSALAHFEREFDLHIEQLREDWKKLSNAEILAIQLMEFDAYLSQALRLGAPTVFVIHGVGKGRLRNEIATRLMNNPDVKTFKNEYHPKYGYGATEVIFE